MPIEYTCDNPGCTKKTRLRVVTGQKHLPIGWRTYISPIGEPLCYCSDECMKSVIDSFRNELEMVLGKVISEATECSRLVSTIGAPGSSDNLIAQRLRDSVNLISITLDMIVKKLGQLEGAVHGGASPA